MKRSCIIITLPSKARIQKFTAEQSFPNREITISGTREVPRVHKYLTTINTRCVYYNFSYIYSAVRAFVFFGVWWASAEL